MNETEQTGQLVFGKKGFILSWDEIDLSVQITDYHVKEICIPWTTILELAKKAGKTFSVAEK